MLLISGCNWNYFIDGDSYAWLMAPDLAELGRCPTVVHAEGAKRLATMIQELPAFEAELADSDRPPLVIFSAGVIEAATQSDYAAEVQLTFWVNEVLKVRPDLRVVQLGHYGPEPWVPEARDPRWVYLEWPELEDSGYLELGPDELHLTPAATTRHVALMLRDHPGLACPGTL